MSFNRMARKTLKFKKTVDITFLVVILLNIIFFGTDQT